MQSSERVWRERGLRAAVLAGDERAWRAWYDECFAGLEAYVRWRCGGLREHADEVVQETWLTAVRRVRSFDPTAGNFASWLRGIASNLLRNHFRRQARREAPRRALVDEHVAPGDRQRPDERGERVARALSALPAHDETVLRAKYLDGRSTADIAAERGETSKGVESLLARARQAFREAYEQPE
jgi:RNA polymerase sigma-70 factor (ECF subfamily)